MAGVLQPYGIEHPGVSLRDAGDGIAEARLKRGALEGKAAETVDIVERGELMAVAEGAGGRDHGIVELNAAEGYAQSSHTIASLSKTGPSLHTRFGPSTVMRVQPMHAPKPQPMRASKLSCPPVGLLRATARIMASGPQV